MEEEFTSIDRFDAYLEGSMAEPERVAFEARLAAEPGLRAQFEAHRSMMASLRRLAEKRALAGKIRELGREEEGGQTWPVRWISFFIAALLLLAVALGVWLLQEEKNPTNSPAWPPARQDTSQLKIARPSDGGQEDNQPMDGTTEIKDAQEPLSRLERQIVAGRITVSEGIPRRQAGSERYIVTVFRAAENTATYERHPGVVDLYVPESQYDRQEEIQLMEWMESGRKNFYIRMGNSWYALPETQGYLELVTEAEILKWLPQ